MKERWGRRRGSEGFLSDKVFCLFFYKMRLILFLSRRKKKRIFLFRFLFYIFNLTWKRGLHKEPKGDNKLINLVKNS